VGYAAVRAEQQHGDVPFEEAFVLAALTFHDFGETAYAETGADPVYNTKSIDKDLAELDEFTQQIAEFPEYMQETWLDRYLLQHVSRRDKFPTAYRKRLEDLARLRMNEAQLFELVERLDYVLYAYHEFADVGNARIMIHTLRNQHAKIFELTRTFKGVAKEIYTAQFRMWAEEILRRHKDDEEAAIPDRSVA
jgi:hypothetical protein